MAAFWASSAVMAVEGWGWGGAKFGAVPGGGRYEGRSVERSSESVEVEEGGIGRTNDEWWERELERRGFRTRDGRGGDERCHETGRGRFEGELARVKEPGGGIESKGSNDVLFEAVERAKMRASVPRIDPNSVSTALTRLCDDSSTLVTSDSNP